MVEPDTEFEDGKEDAVEYFDGFEVRCNNNPESETTFDLAHAYGWSCNLTFARLGNQIGAERYLQYTRQFGLESTPPFPFGIAAGQLSTDDRIPDAELASAAFGQGELLTTPLQMALVAARSGGRAWSSLAALSRTGSISWTWPRPSARREAATYPRA